MKSLSLCIGWVVRETTREHVNPFCTDSVSSVLKASLLSWTSDLAGACIKALQYQVLHTNWFGSSLQTSSCHLSLCCWNGSLNPAVRMLKSIERLMQMPSPILPFVVQAKIQKKKKKNEGGRRGVWVSRAQIRQDLKGMKPLLSFGLTYHQSPCVVHMGFILWFLPS